MTHPTRESVMQENRAKGLSELQNAEIFPGTLEDKMDAQDAEQLLRDFRKSGEEGIPYEIVRGKAGLR